MNDNANAQKESERVLIGAFDREFARSHSRSCRLINLTPTEVLYRGSGQTSGKPPASSVGENVLRGAAAVEQTFGGITFNLWDDPFEWTLPENLSTAARVIEYLEEVEATRKFAFSRFSRDIDLLKEVSVPSGETRPLVDLLTETLARAFEFQGRADVAFELLSVNGLSRLAG